MTETIDSIDRIILKNNANKKIFKEQELIRMKKEAENKAQLRSESDGESDEDEENNPDIKPPKIPEKFRERTRIQPHETVDRNSLPPEPPKPPEGKHQAVEVAPNITIPITINADDSKVLYDQPKNIEISTSKSSNSNDVTFSFKITFKK
ncbi:hypothetical protein TVAG_277970 [Trichomonas vaginalis G3]|uniref:Uncharacterized protein n=1 Tax=Trichomonas vaginalis (strain ATCC PRA-98 / G3) TaxID=412133 RepID=A2DU38_TRIV3|nr:hypothetical protein TVAGG3_0438910 [Trichomonas vaginalis G3]EAY16031.1 hypothetical protein TVAG_277970 [Trichomonas vaginalis G3]KAI5537309.1 hypothetical protein TVAGG3_0438910 [Trichomonas vaginalis G3]|eukprot:XP_001328254.1 hypothetical protein [Trichomonas vaginalis G3]